MSRALVVIRSDQDRQKVQRWAANVKPMTRVEFKETKRTLPQNDKMWAMLTDISLQVPWHGRMRNTEQWKRLFLDALHHELEIVPSLDGTSFVNIGTSSADLGKGEMSDMMELIYKFGAENGVIFGGEK